MEKTLKKVILEGELSLDFSVNVDIEEPITKEKIDGILNNENIFLHQIVAQTIDRRMLTLNVEGAELEVKNAVDGEDYITEIMVDGEMVDE